jgi:hypothetical protein
VALSDRLTRLEGEYGPQLCEERYCMWAPTFVEVIHHPDGTEERVGREPPHPALTRNRCPASVLSSVINMRTGAGYGVTEQTLTDG